MEERKEFVLITGISGYIGSALAKVLSPFYQIIGLDKDVPAVKIPEVTYYPIDITSEVDIVETLGLIKRNHSHRLASVVHLVAYYSFDGTDDDRYQTITVAGTRTLVRQLRKEFNTEQFVFSSSMLVYRPVPTSDRIREDSPLEPKWPYPVSKVKAEEVLSKEKGDIPVVNLRIAGVYDNYCHQPTLAHQIMRIHEGWVTSVTFPGDPATGQAILHLDDLAQLVKILVQKRNELSAFETFVVGEEDVMSYQDIQREVGLLLHKRPWPILRVPKFIAKTGAEVMQHLPFMREPFIKPWMIPHADEHFAVDMSKTRKLLGWEPKHSLRLKLKEIVKNLKEDPSKWYAINKLSPPGYRNLEQVKTEGERGLLFAAITNIFLGLWSIANPFGFKNLESFEFFSEIILGTMIIIVSLLSMIPTLRWLRWPNAGLGCLLMFSPLVSHTGSDAAYLSDTLIGGLVILFSTYTPPEPDEDVSMGTPRGWSYNPSTLGQRFPIMFLAFLGFLLSRNLASYQLGHIQDVWEPFFGNGTRNVLTSDISKAFPVSDAGLGALTYLLDVIAACIGGRSRWRTMPWAVILFGLMIIPTGVTSITLVMLQPIGVGAWCTMCLITAFIMLIMVPPAVDEVLASLQFLREKKKAGDSLWKVFWKGATPLDEGKHVVVVKERGSFLPFLLTSAVGLWLMFTPTVLGISKPLANHIYIIAALVTTFSIIAFSEVTRVTRLFNIPLGVWLIAISFLMNEVPNKFVIHNVLIAVLIMACSLPLGRQKESYGTADKWIHWSPFTRRHSY